jgi:hypothetical protein
MHGKRVEVNLYIDRGDKETNKKWFDDLKGQQPEIEKEMGESLTWERLEHRQGSRIALYRAGSIQDDEASRDEIKAWAIDRLLKFRKVFGPRIVNLVG